VPTEDDHPWGAAPGDERRGRGKEVTPKGEEKQVLVKN